MRLEISAAEATDAVERFIAGGAADEKLSRQLYAHLISPLEEKLGDRRLLVSPSWSLFRLPFEALRNARGYLIEQRSVSYVPT